MLVEYPYGQGYLFSALENGPLLFDHLLAGLTGAEADLRPDPERFTIRETMAHLAEWEAIFLARMERIRGEDVPLLEGYDEGQLALNHAYALADVQEQRRLFRERRTHMLAFLRSCGPEDWQRVGDRPEIGLITLEALAVLVTLHDTYHLTQIAQWRSGG